MPGSMIGGWPSIAARVGWKGSIVGPLGLNSRTELPHWAVLATMFAASLARWRTTPDIVPVHWNARGEIDRYGGRFQALFIIPLVTTGVYIALALVPLIDPQRESYRSFAGAYSVIRLGVIGAWERCTESCCSRSRAWRSM